MPIKMRELVHKSSKDRKQRANRLSGKVKLISAKGTPVTNESGTGFHYTYNYKVQSQSIKGKKYNVVIRTLPSVPIKQEELGEIRNGNIPIIINCNCPDYKYRYEAANWKSSAARKIHSNGIMPDITNPSHTRALCKHAIGAIKDLMKRV